ncbi:MAG: helix-turn-helix domain-containing protein [Myxococcota bacterium]
MHPVLTEAELATLLRVERGVVERLVSETPVPRIVIAGEVRFLTEDVLAWLSRHREPLLEPHDEDTSPTPSRDEEVPEPEVWPPAEADQAPLVSDDALEALGSGAANPSLNLERLQARDALIALGDAVHPTLTRLSGGRLHPHPDEAHRTSPWRVGDVDGAPIEALVLAWAAGEQPVPGFEDRPRVELRLDRHGLSLSLRVPPGVAEPPSGARELYGPTLERSHGGGWAVILDHRFAERAPTLATATRRLERDLERLVPLWREVVLDGA